ncbi:MAG: hypothetical protein JWQ16_1812 [Novosphingobium sp.]|nr:hypothetical protein [Novosphingobium sp.]
MAKQLLTARTLTKLRTGILAAIALGLALPGVAQAQGRDPAYAAARASGQIGEKMDGYLGYIGTPSPSLRAIVEDLNIKRRAVYSDGAKAANATVEEFAFTSGCVAIARTAPGEKYQAPGGAWQTRTSAAPQRDSRCP